MRLNQTACACKPHLLEQLACLNDLGRQSTLVGVVLFAERGWILIKHAALAHDLHPEDRLLDSSDLQ
jgi:hypothetical protein